MTKNLLDAGFYSALSVAFTLIVLGSNAFAGGHTGSTPNTNEQASPEILLKTDWLLDLPGQAPKTNAVIVIQGTRIKNVLLGDPAAKKLSEDNSEIVDLSDHYVLPGLMDAHVHMTFESGARRRFRYDGEQALSAIPFARRTLLSGFTTVRDLASGPNVGFALREAIKQGDIAGPRIVAAGLPVTAAGGHGDFPNMSAPGELHDGVCWDAGSCRNAVRIQIKQGADVIKLTATGGFSSGTGIKQQLFFEEMKAAIDAAHQRGLPVASHAYERDGIMDVVKAGVDSVEHGIFIDAEIAAEMASRGTFLTPTLMVFNPKIADGAAAEASERADLSKAAFKAALQAGVKISFGTDAGVYNQHGTNADEFARMIESGMSPMDAIVAATIHNAELFQLADDLGTIEAGKLADIIAVKNDPLKDISTLSEVAFVMKDGKIFAKDGEPLAP